MSSATITCPACGAELRANTGASCQVCLSVLPQPVIAALAAEAQREAQAVADRARQLAQAAPTPVSAPFPPPPPANVAPGAPLPPGQAPATSGWRPPFPPQPPIPPLGTASFAQPQYAPINPTQAYPTPMPPQVRPVVQYGAAPTNGFAIASLALSILGLCPYSYGILPALAVIFGHIASDQVKKSGGAQEGAGMANAGLVMGYIGIALALLLIFRII